MKSGPHMLATGAKWNGPRAQAGAAGLLGQVFDVLYRWQERAAQRHALGLLDDRMLRDIGLDRARAQAEVQKPFWRA